jgi:signal transduction histidine kinase
LVDPYPSYFKSTRFHPGIIAFNLQNEPLIFSAAKGIICYRKDETQLNITAPEISGFVIENFFIDRENIIWICHDGNGVYKLSNTKLQFLNLFFGTKKLEVRTAKANTTDSCWIVMNNNQLMLHGLLKTKKFFFTSSINVKALHYNKDHLFIVEDHKLYTAAMPDEPTGVIRFKKILTLPDTSSFGKIMVNDPYGQVILSQTFNICVLKKDKILFTYPTSKNDLIEGMYIDNHNKLWVISRSAGLQIFSIHPENPLQYLQMERQFITEFEGASPRSITVDKNEILWVGTRDDGLIGFEYKNSQLIKQYHFQTQNGLADNFITALACDKNNNILVGTQTGLDRLIKANGSYSIENITKSYNIFSNITYIWTDADDNAFALNNAGSVFQIQPVKKTNSFFEPQLLMEEIKINGKVLADFQAPLRLQYQQSNITFSIAAPSFLDEKQVKYSYLLSGSGNKEWSDTASLTDITLLNLAPGKYTLHVKTFFYSTSYTPKQIAFSFVILPPWWQTWWFRVIALIVIIATIFWLVRFYFHRKLQAQKNILDKQQAIEKERTRIAADMHDDLGAGLSTLRFLSEKVKRNSFSKVTRNDTDKIIDKSNDLVQKMNEIIWAMNEKNDTVEDLLFYTRGYAVEYCEENNLECEVDIPETILPHFVSGEVRRNLFLTVKESLHNIVKHADAKKVKIIFFVGKNFLVSINDNGKGFTVNNNGEGNGLKNMKKRIVSIGGNFEILNEKGTIVNITVPLV